MPASKPGSRLDFPLLFFFFLFIFVCFMRCEGHCDSVPLPLCQQPQYVSFASVIHSITRRCSQCCFALQASRLTQTTPLPGRRHMFCHRLSCAGGKGEMCPAVSSGQSAPPHRQIAREVTHFQAFPSIITVQGY